MADKDEVMRPVSAELQDDSSHSAAAGPRGSGIANSPAKLPLVLLGVLAFLYFCGALAAFAVVMLGEPPQVSSQVKAALIRHGMTHGLVSAFCATGLFLLLRGAGIGRLAGISAACFTGLLATLAIKHAVREGFQFYHLIEPLVVIPCVILIVVNLRLTPR